MAFLQSSHRSHHRVNEKEIIGNIYNNGYDVPRRRGNRQNIRKHGK